MRFFPLISCAAFAAVTTFTATLAPDRAIAQPAGTSVPPLPLLDATHPSDWIFAFKLNAKTAPTTGSLTACRFGGEPRSYRSGQHYLIASSLIPSIHDGLGLVGTSGQDPVGATFEKIYRSNLNFVVWNDQFYLHPKIRGCGQSCAGPWGHSKGIIAWDQLGQGLLLQVTTPSWPGSGTAASPRVDDGNTLGCIEDNNVKASQHFFAVRLDPGDSAAVLDALANASVVTDVANPQLARLGGPPELVERASKLGKKSVSTAFSDVMLSSGVRMISKPSALHVPPWQFLSARLGTVPLRSATWWAAPRIPTTVQGRQIICWRDDLGIPARVEIALTGRWNDQTIGLKGGPNDDSNHAKVGVSLDLERPLTIFSDLNQQGRLTGKCDSSQNGRGGLFFVIENAELHAGMSELLAGETAGLTVPVSQKAAPKRAVRRRGAPPQ